MKCERSCKGLSMTREVNKRRNKADTGNCCKAITSYQFDYADQLGEVSCVARQSRLVQCISEIIDR